MPFEYKLHLQLLAKELIRTPSYRTSSRKKCSKPQTKVNLQPINSKGPLPIPSCVSTKGETKSCKSSLIMISTLMIVSLILDSNKPSFLSWVKIRISTSNQISKILMTNDFNTDFCKLSLEFSFFIKLLQSLT